MWQCPCEDEGFDIQKITEEMLIAFGNNFSKEDLFLLPEYTNTITLLVEKDKELNGGGSSKFFKKEHPECYFLRSNLPVKSTLKVLLKIDNLPILRFLGMSEKFAKHFIPYLGSRLEVLSRQTLNLPYVRNTIFDNYKYLVKELYKDEEISTSEFSSLVEKYPISACKFSNCKELIGSLSKAEALKYFKRFPSEIGKFPEVLTENDIIEVIYKSDLIYCIDTVADWVVIKDVVRKHVQAKGKYELDNKTVYTKPIIIDADDNGEAVITLKGTAILNSLELYTGEYLPVILLKDSVKKLTIKSECGVARLFISVNGFRLPIGRKAITGLSYNRWEPLPSKNNQSIINELVIDNVEINYFNEDYIKLKEAGFYPIVGDYGNKVDQIKITLLGQTSVNGDSNYNQDGIIVKCPYVEGSTKLSDPALYIKQSEVAAFG